MSVRSVLVEKNVRIPLRDGVQTYADVYRPADGPPLPAIVTRTPYDTEQSAASTLAVMPSPLKFAERGYVVVVQDVRGRYSSEGEFDPFRNEALDGYDTVEWAAAQDWCDGGVAIYGPSYVGATALLAARERPPSLKCAIPIITADDYYDGWTYQGGAFQLGFATTWGMNLAATLYLRAGHRADPRHAETLISALADGARTLALRPYTEMPGISARDVAPWWPQWLANDRRNEFWDAVRPSASYEAFDVPMLHVGGWFDLFGLGTVRNYRGLSAQGNAQQHLIIGPWAHIYYDRYMGEMDFGPTGSAATSGVIGRYNRFLDQHLKGIDADVPSVRYFLMGANEWRQADAWPPPGGSEQKLYLHSGGSANSARGDGELSGDAPQGSQTPDRFLYDPAHPVFSEGGPTYQSEYGLPGPRDQRFVEQRDDVLCYTTPPLAEPVTVAGPVSLELWAVSDAPDTDWTAKLVDVDTDGKAVSLCDGIIRARFRNSLSEPQPLTPGRPERYTIDLANTAFRFDVGHRIRLEVSSSNFPRFDPNPNTGASTASDTQTRPAVQHVLHDDGRPSALSLWVIPE